MLKKIFLGLLLFFVAIQFVRPAKNISPTPSSADLLANYPAPPEVKRLLAVACYDCHSNNTRYPWYSNFEPVAWWLASHVEDGKKHLNFSDFANYPPKRAARKLQQCIDELGDKTMPLPSYRIGHPDARLTDEQSKLLSDWFDDTRERIPNPDTEK